MRGMDRYTDKKKRAVRRRNHVARDLQDRKYHQRVKGRRFKVQYDAAANNYRWEFDDES